MTAQDFMIPTSRNIDSALALDGSKVCVQEGTTTQLNVADFFRANNIKYQELKFGKLEEALKAYEFGQCDTFTSDVSQLYGLRLRLSKPGDHIILPDVISKEPLAPVVRQRDDDWMMIVKWALYAMINAEELGVTSKNIDEALKSKKPDVMRLVGTEGAYGEALGLTKDWAARIIRHVGNYGEVYERNVGSEFEAQEFRAGLISSGAPAASSTPRRSGDGLQAVIPGMRPGAGPGSRCCLAGVQVRASCAPERPTVNNSSSAPAGRHENWRRRTIPGRHARAS